MARGGHCRLGYSAERIEKLVRSVGFDVVYRARLGRWGDYLGDAQGRLARSLGQGLWAQGLAFCIVFPLYVALSVAPIPDRLRVFHFLIARKPLSPRL